ncbi:aldehyde dehydrogenase family protein [Nonomuraea diastatica]|uniref:Aldehyde dehydrogenase family protein n=1 Tax=Nonomuraea diastatica TaxID=1848329 RepID=A0A4R4X3E8_9ACTN|nr:aldehyde dehydrogenase family protein [Nonomuraea diastatica]TDD24749.1 aldehyde dehydrogenase family protein [Nonomuraea diastatica]
MAAGCTVVFKPSELSLLSSLAFAEICESELLAEAADTLMVAKFRNNGVSCIAANNVWMHLDGREEFLSRLTERISRMVTVDPLDARTTLGPVRTREQVGRLESVVSGLSRAGASVHRGPRPETDGWYVAPALVVDPPADRPERREEICGPVAVVRSFTDLKEPITDAAATGHGLAGYVCTGDATAGMELHAQLDVGIAGVDLAHPRHAGGPLRRARRQRHRLRRRAGRPRRWART